MKVLVVGSGAREHALAWRLSVDSDVEAVYCAPGNAGTEAVARNVPVAPTDVPRLVQAARDLRIDLVVVGPEAPLVAGLVDALGEAGIDAFGPTAAAARLEGSKAFAKTLMQRAGIPTAPFAVFENAEAAVAHLRAVGKPLVVKADGLAAGKGVVVPDSVDHAIEVVRRFMEQRALGEAGARVVLEERLEGPEISYHVLTDGERFVPLEPAQDHKRLLDGDRGPNTGGMGAYSPPPRVDAATRRAFDTRIVAPVLAAMREAGRPLRGALFVGAMLVRGEPYVLEFNVRFGDPECECLLVRWKGPFARRLRDAARGRLGPDPVECGAPASVAVVMAAPGYPENPRRGLPIEGVERAAELPDVHVFHAGTARRDGRLVSDGGRVLAITATGIDVDAAAARAYEAAGHIRMEGAQMRSDIAWQARTR
ncbi:MAG: phosphoribosylamine--glycine ligase [Myxococcota bacterium]|nr:phosphoribosylamine--glycine ligase [Myxococcota bacterium]